MPAGNNNLERFGKFGCYDQLEIGALMGEINDVGPANLEQGQVMLALGQCLLDNCQRSPGKAAGCPFSGDVAKLRTYLDSQESLRYSLAAQRAAALRPYPLPEIYKDFENTVDCVAAQATFLFARASGRSHDAIRHRARFKSGQRDGSCVQMTYIMQRLLEQEGIKTKPLWSGRQPRPIHYFLKTNNLSNEQCYIDPTWQQFLPDNAVFESMPATLIMPESKVAAIVGAHNIPKQLENIWTDGVREGTTDWRLFHAHGLEAVFAEQGWT